MSNLQITKHGQSRLRQRGFRDEDVRLIEYWGTEIRPGVFRMTNDDAKEAMANAACGRQKIDGLRGGELVFSNGWLVTAYFAKAPLRRNPRRGQRQCRRRKKASWRSRRW